MEEKRDPKGHFVKGMKRSEESKKKQSETVRQQYARGEKKPPQLGKTKETDAGVAQGAAKMKGRTPWNKGKKASEDPKLAAAHDESVKTRKANGWHQSEEAKDKLSKYWTVRKEECQKRRKNQPPQPRENTSLERKMQEALRGLQIQFEVQARVLGASGKVYKVDILIGRNLVVECDGEYFHSLPYMVKYDPIKDSDLQEGGFLVIRLKGKDIKMNPRDLGLRIRDEWMPKAASLMPPSDGKQEGYGDQISAGDN